MEPAVQILIVEDDALIAIALQDALQDAGYVVHHVGCGEEALAALNEHEPHLSGLITDIKCGGDVDGWVIARRAREIIPQLPVVYVSGDSANEHTAQGVPDSIMLQKPFAAAQVVTAISTLLNAAPPLRG
ncbi:MAG: response regulator [Sphingomonas sp.]|nr:response regulator [Sphingomonas sp.]